MSVTNTKTSDAGTVRQGHRTTRRGIAAGLAAAAMMIALAVPASAAQPNNQGCLGQDIRSYAAAGAGFGTFVVSLADGGVGSEIRAHLAGHVPDEVIPNSCND